MKTDRWEFNARLELGQKKVERLTSGSAGT